jgi:predicted dehydrogenase
VHSEDTTDAGTTGTEPILRVGVIGLGWAGQQHMKAYAAMDGVELVAIAGQEDHLRQELGDRYEIPENRRLVDFSDLLAIDALDAVSIAVPTFLHAPIAIAALEKGLHVLTEKPIAANVADAERMVHAARSAGRVLEVVFNHRLRGDVQTLRQRIDAGELGSPYFAEASWLRRDGIPQLGGWFTNAEKAGGGPLIDLGVHVLDYSLFLLGEPEVLAVSATTANHLGRQKAAAQTLANGDGADEVRFEVEDFASAFLRLEGGRSLVLRTSWAAYRDPKDRIEFHVLGTEGGADLVDDQDGGTLVLRRDEDGKVADEQVTSPADRHHGGVVHDFVATVRDPEVWSDHDGTTGLRRAQVLEACYRSAAEGHEVTLAS